MAEFARSTALPHLEARRSCSEISCYRPHTHDGFSIGIIDAGATQLTGAVDAPEGPVRLIAGDVVTIPAGRVHSCNPDGPGWRYQMLHADQAWIAGLAPGSAEASPVTRILVLRDPDVLRVARSVTDAVFLDAEGDAIADEMRAMLRALAASRPVNGSGVPDAGDAVTGDPRLRLVLDRLDSDETPPQLRELAELAEMSQPQLIRAVRSATGLTPIAWRQNRRVERARRMLRAGMPIADTAHTLGFTDQSHFHRVFKAHVAASPGVYRG